MRIEIEKTIEKYEIRNYMKMLGEKYIEHKDYIDSLRVEFLEMNVYLQENHDLNECVLKIWDRKCSFHFLCFYCDKEKKH